MNNLAVLNVFEPVDACVAEEHLHAMHKLRAMTWCPGVRAAADLTISTRRNNNALQRRTDDDIAALRGLVHAAACYRSESTRREEPKNASGVVQNHFIVTES